MGRNNPQAIPCGIGREMIKGLLVGSRWVSRVDLLRIPRKKNSITLWYTNITMENHHV